MVTNRRINTRNITIIQNKTINLTMGNIPLQRNTTHRHLRLHLQRMRPNRSMILNSTNRNRHFTTTITNLRFGKITRHGTRTLNNLLNRSNATIIGKSNLIPLPNTRNRVYNRLTLIFHHRSTCNLLITTNVMSNRTLIMRATPTNRVNTKVRRVTRAIFRKGNSNITMQSNRITIIRLNNLTIRRKRSKVLSTGTSRRRNHTTHRTRRNRRRTLLVPRRITNHNLLKGTRILPRQNSMFRRSTLTNRQHAKRRRNDNLLTRTNTTNLPNNSTSSNHARRSTSHDRTKMRLRNRNKRTRRRNLVNLPSSNKRSSRTRHRTRSTTRSTKNRTMRRMLTHGNYIKMTGHFRNTRLRTIFIRRTNRNNKNRRYHRRRRRRKRSPYSNIRPINVLLGNSRTRNTIPIRSMPLTILSIQSLLFNVISLLLTIHRLLLHLNFLHYMFNTKNIRLLFTNVMFDPTIVRPNTNVNRLLFNNDGNKVNENNTNKGPRLTLRRFRLRLPRDNFNLNSRFHVKGTKQKRRPLNVRLSLTLIRLLLMTIRLNMSTIMNNLYLNRNVPRFDMFFINKFNLIRHFLYIIRHNFNVNRRQINRLLRISRGFSLLRLVFGFRSLLLTIRRLIHATLRNIKRNNFLLNRLHFTKNMLYFTLLRLHFNNNRLNFNLIRLLFNLYGLTFNLHFLLIMNLLNVNRFNDNIIGRNFPTNNTLYTTSKDRPINSNVRNYLMFVKVVIVLINIFNLSVASNMVVNNRLAIQSMSSNIRGTITNNKDLLIKKGVRQILRLPRRNVENTNRTINTIQRYRHNTSKSLFPITRSVRSTFINDFKRPTYRRRQTIRVLNHINVKIYQRLLSTRSNKLINTKPTTFNIRVLRQLSHYSTLNHNGNISIILKGTRNKRSTRIRCILLCMVFLPNSPRAKYGTNGTHRSRRTRHCSTRRKRGPTRITPRVPRSIFSVAFLRGGRRSVYSANAKYSLA